MPQITNNKVLAIRLPSKEELADIKLEPNYDDKQKLVNLKFSYKKTGETEYTMHELKVMPFSSEVAISLTKQPDLLVALCNLSTVDKIKTLGQGQSFTQALEAKHTPRVSLESAGSPVLLPSIEVSLASLLFNPHLIKQFDLSDFTVMSALSESRLSRTDYNVPDDFKFPKKDKGIFEDIKAFNKYLEKKANPSLWRKLTA